MKKSNLIVLFILSVFLIFTRNNAYSVENSGLILPYDIGNEDTVRNENELKTYIQDSIKKGDRMYFKNQEEVMFAQQFGYISKETGEVIYKKRPCCSAI